MRKCGGCTVCCTVTAVPELSKPHGQSCLFCKDAECKVYETRPQSCRAFECAWLQGDMPTWMRPDKVHVMIERLPSAPVVLALIEPGHDDWRDNKDVVDVLRDTYQFRGIAVVASDKLALLPEGRSADEVMQDVTRFARSVGAISGRADLHD